MRFTFFFVFLFWTMQPAISNTELVEEAEAHEIAYEILSKIEPFEEEILALRHEKVRDATIERITEILTSLNLIGEPYFQAFQRDMELGASRFEAEQNASQLSKVRMCYETIKSLGELAIATAITERRPLVPSRYLSFLIKRLECNYQLGEEPPSHLVTPEDVYRDYLDLLKRTLQQMADFDDPVFLADAMSDPEKWIVLRKQVLWKLYAEQQWDLYKLYSITARNGPMSETFRETIRSLWPCQTIHGSYRQLTDKYAFALVSGLQPLLNRHSFARLLKKASECEALLAK